MYRDDLASDPNYDDPFEAWLADPANRALVEDPTYDRVEAMRSAFGAGHATGLEEAGADDDLALAAYGRAEEHARTCDRCTDATVALCQTYDRLWRAAEDARLRRRTA
jgi:hypothetical protein